MAEHLNPDLRNKWKIKQDRTTQLRFLIETQIGQDSSTLTSVRAKLSQDSSTELNLDLRWSSNRTEQLNTDFGRNSNRIGLDSSAQVYITLMDRQKATGKHLKMCTAWKVYPEELVWKTEWTRHVSYKLLEKTINSKLSNKIKQKKVFWTFKPYWGYAAVSSHTRGLNSLMEKKLETKQNVMVWFKNWKYLFGLEHHVLFSFRDNLLYERCKKNYLKIKIATACLTKW